LAVLRLMTNSNCVDCSTGSSAGLEPVKIHLDHVTVRLTRTISGPKPLQKGAHFPIEDIRALEIRRVAGHLHPYEMRARNLLVDLLRQLGPDQSVLVAGQEEGRHPGGRIALHGRGQAAELFPEV